MSSCLSLCADYARGDGSAQDHVAVLRLLAKVSANLIMQGLLKESPGGGAQSGREGRREGGGGRYWRKRNYPRHFCDISSPAVYKFNIKTRMIIRIYRCCNGRLAFRYQMYVNSLRNRYVLLPCVILVFVLTKNTIWCDRCAASRALWPEEAIVGKPWRY